MNDAGVPLAVDVDRTRGVRLTWDDETVTDVDLETLRQRCPCAECRNCREHGQAVWPTASSPRPLRIDDAEIVGGYGLSVTWNDGHRTGIYSWELLRSV